MPCISDPGYDIVVEAVAEQYHVIPLPGANAALTALIASVLKQSSFISMVSCRETKRNGRWS